MVVGAAEPQQGRHHLVGRDLPVEEAQGQLDGPRAIAAPGQELRRVLLRPSVVAAGVEQHQVGQAGRVPQRVLERHVAAERVAEHGPPLEPQPPAQRLGVRRQVLPGHRRDGAAVGTPVAAVVVEDQGEPVRETPERQQRAVVCPWPAVHEHQRVAPSDDLDKQGHVSDRHGRHDLTLQVSALPRPARAGRRAWPR